jgi:cytochrome d ubiquinol oxidase subunit II
MGLVAFTTLTAHGANFIAMKTAGALQQRSRAIAAKAWWGVLAASILALIATSVIRPAIWDNYAASPWGFIFPVIGLLSWIGGVYYRAKHNDTRAFLSSTAFIAGMAASTAFGLFPNVLPASTDPQHSLTVYNTAAPAYGLGVGLVWWIIGMAIAVGYFAYLFYSFRGKLKLPAEGEGY